MKTLWKSVRITVAFCIFFSVFYILVLWIFAQFAGPNKGNAEVLTLNGKAVGAANVGQMFTEDIYFWGRPSCAGDGSNVRDWLYVEDHCKAIDLVVRKGVEGEVYNVGGHNEKTNLEIVKLTIATIRRLMEEEPKYRAVLKKQVKDADGQIDISWINEDLITFVKDRLGHDQRYAIDPTKITDALGWYPETKFEVGIVKTIEWYLNNQDWVEEVTSGDYQKYYERMYGKK